MTRALLSLTLCATLPLTGCAYWRAAESPMPWVFHEASAGEADTLVVLLPGMGDTPEDFVTRGFVDEIRRQAPHCDMIAADAHLGYYRSRTVLERLRADVIQPRAADYEHIWLVGISLGGFGSAVYTQAFRDDIDGLILLAPFLGDDEVIDTIRTAGGLANWQPPTAAELAARPRNLERKTLEIWSLFRDLANHAEDHDSPRLLLGWGIDDGFHANITLIADSLPSASTISIPGGHGWVVWQPLFAELAGRALAQ